VEFRSKGSVSIQDYMGDDCTIVNAARVSFARNGTFEIGGAERGLIRFLLENRHGTPFEHVTFTFLVECPIFVAREWFRHRIGSFNEVSGRYSELAPVFWVPEVPRTQRGKAGAYHFTPIGDPVVQARTNITLEALYGLAWQAYEALLSDGVAKEVARTVLPVGTFTRFYWTVNLRSLFNFLSLRNAPQAQAEIRELAQQVEDIVSAHMPETMSTWRTAGGTAV
jgi:thymidylate synthase (FAD)